MPLGRTRGFLIVLMTENRMKSEDSGNLSQHRRRPEKQGAQKRSIRRHAGTYSFPWLAQTLHPVGSQDHGGQHEVESAPPGSSLLVRNRISALQRVLFAVHVPFIPQNQLRLRHRLGQRMRIVERQLGLKSPSKDGNRQREEHECELRDVKPSWEGSIHCSLCFSDFS